MDMGICPCTFAKKNLTCDAESIHISWFLERGDAPVTMGVNTEKYTKMVIHDLDDLGVAL